MLLYKNMVRSYLDYCSSVWSPYRKFDIEDLEKYKKGNQTIAQTQMKKLLWQIKSMQIAYTTLQIYTGRYDRNI